MPIARTTLTETNPGEIQSNFFHYLNDQKPRDITAVVVEGMFSGASEVPMRVNVWQKESKVVAIFLDVTQYWILNGQPFQVYVTDDNDGELVSVIEEIIMKFLRWTRHDSDLIHLVHIIRYSR